MRNWDLTLVVFAIFLVVVAALWRYDHDKKFVCVRKHMGVCVMVVNKTVMPYACEQCDEWKPR